MLQDPLVQISSSFRNNRWTSSAARDCQGEHFGVVREGHVPDPFEGGKDVRGEAVLIEVVCAAEDDGPVVGGFGMDFCV